MGMTCRQPGTGLAPPEPALRSQGFALRHLCSMGKSQLDLRGTGLLSNIDMRIVYMMAGKVGWDHAGVERWEGRG